MLMVIVNATYEFIMVNIGTNGRVQSINQRNSLQFAKKAKGDFCEYFNNEGSVLSPNKYV